MIEYQNTIASAYDAGVTEEYSRLTENILREAEFKLVCELLNEYIPKHTTILDIGSGPGRYAEFLLKHDCNVGLVDLSAKSLKSFSDRMIDHSKNKNVIFNEVSCATELDWIADNSADTVLLMGPLYHIVSQESRAKAINHCKRILKPNGIIFAVFLSPYPKINPVLEMKEVHFSDFESFSNELSNNVTFTEFKGYDVPQYRCWPCEAIQLLDKFNFKMQRIRNLEGVGAFFPKEKYNTLDTDEKRKSFFQILQSTCENTNLRGITNQYIYVGKLDK